MGSAIEKVSVFVIGMLIAETIVATLIKWEGDAIGADDWRPLSTIVGVITLLVVSSHFLLLPPKTAATGAVGSAAPFVICHLIAAEGFSAAGAILHICRCADVATSPIVPPILPLASIISLSVVREEEEEEEEQQPAPPCCSQH